MPLRKHRRKIVAVAGVTVGGLLAALISVPLWLPWMLKPLLEHSGVHYAAYERVGFSRFALRGCGLTNKSLSFHADRVEALMPTLWAWRCLRTPLRQDSPVLYITGWRCSVLPSEHPEGSTYDQFDQVSSALQTLERWLPEAVLSNGIAQLHAPNLNFPVPSAAWFQGSLSVQLLLPIKESLPKGLLPLAGTNLLDSALCELRLQPGSRDRARTHKQNNVSYSLQAKSEALGLNSEFFLDENTVGLDVHYTNLFLGNRFEGRTHFGRQGSLPESAFLQATNFQFSSDSPGLRDYGPMAGSATASWENGKFKLELEAGAKPKSSEAKLPPVEISLQVQGDTNSATIPRANISASWLQVELSQGLTLHYSGALLQNPATLKLRADLNRQPWLAMKGTLSGEVNLSPAGETLKGQFQLSGSDLGTPEIIARTLDIVGTLDWPELEIRKAQATMDDGSEAEVSGKLRLDQGKLADGHMHLRGPYARRWLPAGTSYGELKLDGTFAGPFREVAHRGRVELENVTLQGLRPLNVQGEWSGRNLSLNAAQLNLGSGPASVQVAGAFAAAAEKLEFRITTLSVLTNEQVMLQLAQPFQLKVQTAGSSRKLRLDSTPIAWSGMAGHVNAKGSAEWPEKGQLQISATNLALSVFADFSAGKLPNIKVKSLDARIGWTNGPAVFGIDLVAASRVPASVASGPLLSGRFEQTNAIAPGLNVTNSGPQPSTNLEFAVNLALSGDHQGLVISNLAITTQTSQVAVLKGSLPITVSPAFLTNLWHLEKQGLIRGTIAIQPDELFWNQIAAWTGITLQQPKLNLDVSGTWAVPRGLLDLEATTMQLKLPGTPLPSLEDLRVSLEVDAQRARLARGELLVQGQPLSVTAEVPLSPSFWSGLRSPTVPNWQKGKAHLQMHGVKLAAFEPLYPKLITSKGTMNVDISLHPGLKLDGEIDVEDGATRPLGQVGPIRNIDVKIRLAEGVAQLKNASAMVGDAPVHLSGEVNLKGTEWVQGEVPPFQVSLEGTNLVLQRQPESIIRADLKLNVLGTNGAPPLISGTALLKNSYYLSDLSALVPGKIATGERRPPYFSISDPALADWRLAVTVDGVRFLKVRSTLFNGEVSTNLKLQGILREPIALGDARVDSGYVRFPFATFNVQQGLVTLSSRDPYRPQVLVNAGSRQYGYDIRMNITGTADAPMVQFSSTPPLSSEQILLMVTAGEMPQTTFSLTTQQRAQTVALFFGRDLLAKLGVGDQGQERLTISSGQEISQEQRPTYNVEYKVNDHWSVVGAYDRFGDFNAGFKWLIYSK